MIAAWMLYTLAVTALLFAGASAAEYVARAARVPARFVWAAAMLAALGLSGRALTRGPEAQRDIAVPAAVAAGRSSDRLVIAGYTQPTTQQAIDVTPAGAIHDFVIAAREGAAAIRRIAGRLDAARLDVARFDRWNAGLVALCLVATCVAFLWLVGALARLRAIESGLAAEMIDDEVVLVSNDVGPAIFGIIRARVVLPRWVLSLPGSDRNIILAHERQHAAAFDPALLCAAAVALALQPWNVALWALFAGLRFALEADCDRRVLATTGDARRYGRLLVSVYERTMPTLIPHIAFVERPSDLERRIRRMTRRPRLVSIAGATAAVLTLLLSTAAWTIAAPVRWAGGQARAESRVQLLPPVTTVGRGVTRASALQSKISAINVTSIASQGTLPPLGLTPSITLPRTEVHEAPMPSMPLEREGPCKPRGAAQRPDVSMHMIGDNLIVNPACTVDGDVVMVALDSSRVLVAWRDKAEADIQNIEYLIFTTDAGSVPQNLTWSTTAGHAELGGSTFYFASPASGVPSAAFGPSNTAFPNIDSTALHFVVRRLEILRKPSVPWDVLRQLPTAPRCTAPVIIIDGVVTSDARAAQAAETRDCFIVNGQMIRLLR
jgi:beta-lactamase regulating signal transducer with metallopeptidase domain